MTDHPSDRSVELHRQIRAWLVDTMADETPTDVALALMSEIASIAAASDLTTAQVDRFLNDLLDVARVDVLAARSAGP